jgi:hypothetical protein
MNKPILKVHIGVHKTGTTYIQTLLKNNRKRLARHGVLYPLSGLHGSGHAALGQNYLDEQRRAHLRKSNILADGESALSVRDNILYEHGLMKTRIGSTIVSAEGLAIADNEGVKRFAEHYLPYFDVQIIVFLRRQDFMAESSRAQAYTVNQIEFDPRGPFSPDNVNYNFTHVLNCWNSQFDEKSITVVEYPEDQGSHALRELTFDLFGLPGGLEVDDQRVNERLGRDVLEYIYEHSKLVYDTRPYFKALKRLGRYSSQHPSELKYRHFYSPQERLEILDTYRESNVIVSSMYRPGLFSSCPAVAVDEEWEPYPGLTKEQVAVFDKLLAGIIDEK